MNRRADRNYLVGIDSLVRFPLEKRLHLRLNARHPRHPADQENLVDLFHGNAGILERDPAGFQGAVDQIAHQLLQLCPRQRLGEVLGSTGIGSDEGQVDFRLGGRGQLVLGALGGFLQSLQSSSILAQVDLVRLLKFLRQIVDQPLVEILPTQEGIAVSRFDLEDPGIQLEDGDIERAPTQVVDRDLLRLLLLLLLQPVGQRRRRRLVDDPKHVQAGDSPRVLGGLALGVVEIGGHGNHGVGDRLSQVVVRRLLHLHQNHRRNLRRAVGLASHLHPRISVIGGGDVERAEFDRFFHFFRFEFSAEQALDREDRVLGIGDRLTLGDLTDQPFAALGKGHHRRRGSASFAVGNDDRFAAFHDRYAGVGGP